jgi:hypothetical protein
MTDLKAIGLILLIVLGAPPRPALKRAPAWRNAALIPKVIAVSGLGALGNAAATPLLIR